VKADGDNCNVVFGVCVCVCVCVCVRVCVCVCLCVHYWSINTEHLLRKRFVIMLNDDVIIICICCLEPEHHNPPGGVDGKLFTGNTVFDIIAHKGNTWQSYSFKNIFYYSHEVTSAKYSLRKEGRVDSPAASGHTRRVLSRTCARYSAWPSSTGPAALGSVYREARSLEPAASLRAPRALRETSDNITPPPPFRAFVEATFWPAVPPRRAMCPNNSI